MSKDYYKTLGVEKNASKDDIKKAFRKLAHEHHPDKKGGNEAKFKEANEAYSVLSDDSKRAQYDQFGSAGPSYGGGSGAGAGRGGFGGFSQGQGFDGFDFSGFQQGGSGQGVEFDLGDIFGDFFGGGRGGGRTKQARGRDISVDIEIDFKDSIFGTDKKISLTKMSKCTTCSGTGGKPGTGTRTCTTCNGQGKVEEIKRSFLGQFSQVRTCPTCNGKGQIPKETCDNCRGAGVFSKQEEFSVTIPGGIDNGQSLRMTGAGEAVAHGTPGDLYIKVHVKKHPIFTKDGNNLSMTLDVKLTSALLGEERTISALDGGLVVKIPRGVSHGEILRVRGKGVPIDSGRRGDLLIKINTILPKKLSRTAEKLIEELKGEGV